MQRWPRLLLLAVCMAAVPYGSARAQNAPNAQSWYSGEDEPDSTSACAAVDSAVVDSAVQSAIAAERGPRPVQPKLIIVERTLAPAYHSLDAAQWQTVDMGGVQLSVAPIHTDPATRVRQLLLRLPPNAVVPAHWHGGHETLLVIRGTLVVRDTKDRVVRLAVGGFNFEPAAAIHSLATGPDAGALVLITSDGAWDIHLPEDQRGAPSDNNRRSPAGARGGDVGSLLQ